VTRVVDNPAASRFELYADDDTLAGFAAYELHPDRIVFTHTEIDPAFEGRGLGSRLAAGALDGVRGRYPKVVARCPFIARYLARHDEYADLR
jgi:uncharacterized protein